MINSRAILPPPRAILEVELLLMSGKGPQGVRVELLKRYGVGGATEDVVKYGRIPTECKITAFAASMKSRGTTE